MASAIHPSDLEKRQEISRREVHENTLEQPNIEDENWRQEMQEICQTGTTDVKDQIVQEYDYSSFVLTLYLELD